jgi:hypothetical protein
MDSPKNRLIRESELALAMNIGGLMQMEPSKSSGLKEEIETLSKSISEPNDSN